MGRFAHLGVLSFGIPKLARNLLARAGAGLETLMSGNQSVSRRSRPSRSGDRVLRTAPWIAALEKVRYEGYVNPFMHGELEVDAMAQALTKSRIYLQDCRSSHKASES